MCSYFYIIVFCIPASSSPLRIESPTIVIYFFLRFYFASLFSLVLIFHLVFLLVLRWYSIFGCLFLHCHFLWSSFCWILGDLPVSCYGNCCAQLMYCCSPEIGLFPWGEQLPYYFDCFCNAWLGPSGIFSMIHCLSFSCFSSEIILSWRDRIKASCK